MFYDSNPQLGTTIKDGVMSTITKIEDVDLNNGLKARFIFGEIKILEPKTYFEVIT